MTVALRYKLLPAAVMIIVALLILMISIIHASFAGGFGKELSAILDMRWGRVTLIDLYAGFLLVSLWIFWREENRLYALCWITLIMLLGNLASCVYALLAIYKTGPGSSPSPNTINSRLIP